MIHNSKDTEHVTSTQRLKPPKSIKILIVCVAIVATVVTAVRIFNVPFDSLFYIGALLVCPLMHILMMQRGDHKH